MAYNVVKVLEIESGAELDDTVYDQWVRIKAGNDTLSVFDMDMKAGPETVGDYQEIMIGAMFTELEVIEDGPMLAKGNQFSDRVTSVVESDGLFDHVVDINGLKIILTDHVNHRTGSILKFKARLDLLNIRGSTGGWSDA